MLVALLRGAGATDASLLGRACREAHQLKGTAGAYGFQSVSRCAALVEETLGASASDADWQALGSMLDTLVAAAKRQCEDALATVCSSDTHAAPGAP